MSRGPAAFGSMALCWLLGNIACAAEQGAGEPAPAYQDRYIDGGTLQPDYVADDQPTHDSGGLARSLRVDQVASVLSSSGGGQHGNVTEHGLVLNSQWDSVHYGSFSLDGSARTGASGPGVSQQGQGGTLALRQRGMPFDGGWQADNALGNINTQQIGLARGQSRFYLPTAPMRGLSSEWRGPRGIQLVASAGQPGSNSGIEVADFNPLGGSIWTLGGQWDADPHWSFGAQHASAHDVGAGQLGPYVAQSRFDSVTTLASAAWHDDARRSQLTVLDGGRSGRPSSTGAWLDTSIRSDGFRHAFGVFRVEPGLTWANQPIATDVQGGYYRFGTQRRRWLADAGVDLVESVSGSGGRTAFLTGDTRYQLSGSLGLGGVANLSRSNGENRWMLQGYVDRRNRFGTGSVQAGYAHDAHGHDATLLYNQTWKMSAGTHLGTSLSAERFQDSSVPGVQSSSTVLGLALAGGGQLGRNWTFEGNLRLLRTVQGRGAPAVNSNFSVGRRLSSSWLLLASFYDSEIGAWRDLNVNSPLTPPIELLVPKTQERGLFLTVRYQRSAGLHFAPLGGAPGTGAGELTGYVYLDANQNGRMDPGEAGAEQISVVLDHRYSVLTDARGHYDFGPVAAGEHTLEVVMDNLPLPWTFNNQAPVKVEIHTRTRAAHDFAATRMH